MVESFEKTLHFINNSQNILLAMHERMDGDDGGALLAVGTHLETLGKRVTYAIKKGVPPNLAFLPHSHKIQDDINETGFDLLMTFGCSSLSRTGNTTIENLSCNIINIDHHPDNSYFGTVNMVDAKKSSVAELVYDFFNFATWPITKDIATCLLTGIITDTGSFQHSNTQSSTLKVASTLMQKGALTNKITQQTFKNKSPQILKAWGIVLENSRYNSKNGLIYSVISEEDLKIMGPLPAASFEGLTETLNAVPEASYAMLLRQDGEIIKGSLRSGDKYPKNIDVSKIAQRFGGGGHKQASGFAIQGKLIKDKNNSWKIV